MELNVEQSRLIMAEPNGPTQIKGVAGSGKTTVALHRALFLHKNHCFNPEDYILFVTYNKTLIGYLKHIYTRMEKKYREHYANIFSDNETKVVMSTADSLIYQQYLTIKGNKALKPLYPSEKSRKIFRDCITENQRAYRDVNILDHNNTLFLMDEIDWLKSCNYTDLEEYQKVDRIGRARAEDSSAPQRLAKNSKTRQAIFDLMKLFDRRLREGGYIFHKDMAIEVCNEALKNPKRLYKHIIIDEGQDLTRVQLEYLKTLHRSDKDSSLTFIVDKAQSIYSHAWLVKGRNFTSIGLDMSGRGNTLSKNYRTSTQVAQAAYSMIEKDNEITSCEDYVPPSFLDRQGQYPVLRAFNSEKNEAKGVSESIKKLIAQGYEYSDIIIIARMRKQFDCIKDVLDSENIPCKVSTTASSSFKVNHIQIMTIHAIKGLEYKVVFIIGLNSDVIPFYPDNEQELKSVQETSERKLLYVGMTRAREQLYLSYWGKPSKFVEDINPKYLRSASESKVKSYYKVSVDDYLFNDKIQHTYSSEEEIRQWLIRELIETYRYPVKLIELERKVVFGSKTGVVDIAVNTYQSSLNKFAPMIFIETKAPGKDLTDGMEQLKSYMAVCQTCQFGVLTDGRVFIVINRNFELISDIPLFHRSMLHGGADLYSYIDLRTKEKCTLKIDHDSSDRVMVVKNAMQEDYSGSDAREIPVFESVAAGSASVMNEATEGHFYLPANWFNRDKKVFILKVKGDSMIGAGIDDGDLVVAESRNDAKNRDIVIVAFEDESMIKRFSPMNETVLLLSENEKYEPLHVRSEHAKILGVALGVIKAGALK